MRTPKLTRQQRLFANHVARGKTQKEAAKLAGYSAKSAETQGANLMKKTQVLERIEEIQQDMIDASAINAEKVILEMARIAFGDPRMAFDEDGNLKHIKDWPDGLASRVSSIKIVEETTLDDGTVSQVKEIKFWSKDKNLENLGRKLGIFNDKLKIESVDRAKELDELKKAAENAKKRE